MTILASIAGRNTPAQAAEVYKESVPELHVYKARTPPTRVRHARPKMLFETVDIDMTARCLVWLSTVLWHRNENQI